MKIIDQTPFYKENGELSLMNRGKAMMRFGAGWFNEIEAQKSVIPVFEKNLDKGFTLLRNVTPPGLDASIPFILVGPPGVFVMYVTPITGMFRAKGDQWGTITGNTFKPEKPNLLARTERMARAIQVYLQRQGYTELTSVEAILLCSDPAVHVDSLRPIIRVVMRDALERFIISMNQARIVFSPETVHAVVNRILTPPAPTPPPPVQAQTTVPASSADEPVADGDTYVPAFALPGSEVIAESVPPSAGSPNPSGVFPQAGSTPVSGVSASLPVRRRGGMKRNQWILLIGGFIIWFIIIAAFGVKIYLDLYH
jgi:hypothetical protein